MGSWSAIDVDPNDAALCDASAGIAADGTVQLSFMFLNGDTPPRAYVVATSGMLVAQCAGRVHDTAIDDPTASTEYRAAIEAAAAKIEGTATIKFDR